jgi:hypothetical protein
MVSTGTDCGVGVRHSDCAGQSKAPTAGCPTSAGSAPTPTGAAHTASPSSASPSRSFSPPRSSTGETDGPDEHLSAHSHVDKGGGGESAMYAGHSAASALTRGKACSGRLQAASRPRDSESLESDLHRRVRLSTPPCREPAVCDLRPFTTCPGREHRGCSSAEFAAVC